MSKIIPALLFLSLPFFSCSDGTGHIAEDSLRKQIVLDSLHSADSLAKKRTACNPELCSMFADSIDYEKIKTILANAKNVNCFCEFEGEYTKLGARIPIIKDFFKKKTRHYQYQSTPLQFATGIGDTLLMRMFLNAGADFNLADSGQNRPIQIALFHEDEDAFKLLVAYGADLRNTYIDPLFHSEEWLKICIAHGGNFNIPQEEEHLSGLDPKTNLPQLQKTRTLPLHETTDYDKLKIMLEAGANPNDTVSGGKTFLHALMEWGTEEDLDLALKYHADLYAKDAAGKLPLHDAILNNNTGLLKKLYPLYNLKKAGITKDELIRFAEQEGKNTAADYLRKQKA